MFKRVYAQSITDVMKDYGDGKYTAPDSEKMSVATNEITGVVGYALSFIIIAFFSVTTLTTALDLLYLGVPALRPTLYSGGRCFISSDLKRLLGSNQTACYNHCKGNQGTNASVYIPEYAKERAVSLVITVVVLILLVGSSVFTDAGLNIGQFIIDQFSGR